MDQINPTGQYLHLIIHDNISPAEGGIQNTAYRLAVHLAGKNLRVVVAGKIDESVFEGYSVDVFSLRKSIRSKYSSDPRLFFLLVRLRLRYGRKVILYSFLINNIKVFRWLKPFLGWKCVSFLHGNEMLRLYRKKRGTLDRSIRTCMCVIANSQFTRDYARRIRDYQNIIIVHPGISEPLYTGYSGPDFRETENIGDRKIILMLSRLVRRKGHETVIRCIPRLLSRHPDILVLIAGKGGYRLKIETMIRNAGVEDHFMVLGQVAEEEKLSLYRACDVYCMPSEASEEQFEVEGFGMTLIEAAAMGKIAIGSLSGGMPDAVEDRVSGFLIEPGNDRQLENILDDIFTNPAKYENLRRYAKERALRDFNWEKQGDEILNAVEAFLL